MFTDTLVPVIDQLEQMNLEKDAFVVLSIVGQDLLAHDQCSMAVEVFTNS